jgi:hypothetical protein
MALFTLLFRQTGFISRRTHAALVDLIPNQKVTNNGEDQVV